MSILHSQRYFYVIMPLGSDIQAERKKQIIREVAKTWRLIARFPEYDRENYGFDLQSMIQEFKQAQFIVADLSFERPSCYYETGIAEALGAKVYLIAVQGTHIHQTSNRESLQFYEDLEHLGMLIHKTLEQAKKEGFIT